MTIADDAREHLRSRVVTMWGRCVEREEMARRLNLPVREFEERFAREIAQPLNDSETFDVWLRICDGDEFARLTWAAATCWNDHAMAAMLAVPADIL